MTTPCRIRPYRAADHDRCAALFERVMHETFPEDDPAIYAADSFARLTAGEEIWVVEDGDAIVGLVTLWASEPFVHLLLIVPAWRRKGLGSALMKTATAEVRGTLHLKCRLDNEPARRFYEACGWQEADRTQDGQEPYITYRLIRT